MADHSDLGFVPDSDLGFKPDSPEGKPSVAGTFVQHAWDQVNPLPAVVQAVSHPIDTATGIAQSHFDQFRKAYDSLYGKSAEHDSLVDKLSSAFGHTLAGSVPLLGPVVANSAEHLGNSLGDMQANGATDENKQELAGSAGDLTGIVGSALLGKVGGKLAGKTAGALTGKVGDYVDKVSHSNPLPPEARALAQSKGIPLTAGDLTGSRPIQHAEKFAGHAIGGQDIAADVHTRQKASANQAAEDLAFGMQTSPTDAIDNVKTKLSDKIKSLDTEADQHYDKFRNLSNQNATTTQVPAGNSPILGPNGQPFQATAAQSVSFPVDMSQIKKTWQPIYDKMNQVNEVVRHGDKGYLALKDLMDAPDVVSADVAEGALGKLKSISRTADHPDLRIAAQGLSARTSRDLQGAIDTAVSGASPEALDALQKGRQSVAKKYEVADTLKQLGYDFKQDRFTGNPLDRLTNGKFSSYPTLKKVLDVEPSLKSDLAQAHISSMFEPLMRDGGFGGVGGASGPRVSPIAKKWADMNPNIKDALYGKQHARDISSFFDVAKRLEENPNSSNTGAANQIAHYITGAGGVLGAAWGHPSALAAPVAGAAAIRGLAKILYNPEATSKLRSFVSNGPNSKLGKTSLQALRTMNKNANWFNVSGIAAVANVNNQLNQEQSNQ